MRKQRRFLSALRMLKTIRGKSSRTTIPRTVVKATIVGLTTFGAFANIIPGIDGLIHISQIANKRIEKPADVLKVGDVVEAKITAIDFDKKRVSLSMRALLPEDEQAPAKSEEAAE